MRGGAFRLTLQVICGLNASSGGCLPASLGDRIVFSNLFALLYTPIGVFELSFRAVGQSCEVLLSGRGFPPFTNSRRLRDRSSLFEILISESSETFRETLFMSHVSRLMSHNLYNTIRIIRLCITQFV